MASRTAPGLDRVADALERWLPGLVLAAAVVGLAVPAAGRRVADANGINLTLAVLVLASGLSVTPGRLRAARPVLPRLAFVLAGSTLLLPLVALVASRLVADPVQRGGVLAAGVAPAEVASVAITAMAGADVAVAAGLLVGSTLLSMLVAGHVLAVLAGHAAAPPGAVLAVLTLVVGMPLAAGLVIRARWAAAPRLEAAARALAVLAVTGLVWLVASQATVSTAYVRVVIALLVFLAGSVLVGVVLASGLRGSWRLGMVLPVAMRDFAVAAGIAVAAFGRAAAAPLAVYGLLIVLFGVAVARAARVRQRPAAAALTARIDA
jgi:BASS family bile acid:Na+ symporter